MSLRCPGWRTSDLSAYAYFETLVAVEEERCPSVHVLHDEDHKTLRPLCTNALYGGGCGHSAGISDGADERERSPGPFFFDVMAHTDDTVVDCRAGEEVRVAFHIEAVVRGYPVRGFDDVFFGADHGSVDFTAGEGQRRSYYAQNNDSFFHIK